MIEIEMTAAPSDITNAKAAARLLVV